MRDKPVTNKPMGNEEQKDSSRKSAKTDSFTSISDIEKFIPCPSDEDEFARRKMFKAIQVKNAWERVADQAVLEHTDNIFVFMKDGKRTMVCYVDSPIWAAELNADSFRFRMSMERELGGDPIEVVKFVTSRKSYERKAFKKRMDSPASYEEAVPSIPLTGSELKHIEDQAEKITSPELRKSLLEARIKDLEWKKGIQASK